MTLHLVATCGLGLEELLEGELRSLGVEGVERQRGAVTFRGRWVDCWRANWCLRTANRVLVELGRWNGQDGDALAAGARNLVRRRGRSWDGMDAGQLFRPERSLSLHATATASRVRDTRWVALRVKDGLVDGQRNRFGRRSSVDRADPDIPLRVWLFKDQATLLLDTSGTPLDRRGYRKETVAAPLREHLAAACVLASGWDGRGPVMDPMCGSGTLLVEAAFVALGWAPGRLRESWAFQRLPNFRPEEFTAVRGGEDSPPPEGFRLHGLDLSRQALQAASVNLAAAGLFRWQELERGDAFDVRPPPGPGLLLCNPAYGERLEESEEQWRRLGDLLKQRFRGWKAVVLAGDPSRGKHIGLRPSRRIPVRNGPLDARILTFDLY